MSTAQNAQQTAAPKLAGYNFIVDDGAADAHGFFIPKPPVGNQRSVCNCGIEVVDVPKEDLLDMLSRLRQSHTARLAVAGLAGN